MNELETFHDIAADPYRYAETWKIKFANKVIGYFCSYTPEELIHAAGALPVRIFSGTGNTTLADAHLQTYCCSLARSGLEEALSGKLGFLDGAVFPHTCDTIQRLSDIWRINAGVPLHFDVVLPVKLNSKSAHDYLIAILHKFRRELEQGLGIEISDQKLRASIRLYNHIRKALTGLYQLRSQQPKILSGSDVYSIMKSAMTMDRENFLIHLKNVLVRLAKKKESARSDNRKRIILAGGICSHPDIYSILEAAGGVVIWDDLCTGSRYFSGQMDEASDPIEAIAARYIERAVCPTKHFDLTRRSENLVQLVKDHHADGVIFLFLKFCDPHAFDYPWLKDNLDKAAIPSMLLEIDDQLTATGQLRTRLEAFVEML